MNRQQWKLMLLVAQAEIKLRAIEERSKYAAEA
jgi:hypothetical protein